jgi:hypothetical protein
LQIPGRKKFDAVLDKPACAPFRTELQEVLKEANCVRQQIKYQSLTHTPVPIADLHGTFPCQSTCGDLVDGYMRTLEPMYRIVHVPSFLRDYRAIWDEDSTQAAPHSFYAKLALILAIGTTFYATSSDEELEDLRRKSQTWIQSVQTWIAGPAEKTICTIDGFQTLCLLFLARHTTYNCAGESAWFSAKSILSTAMTMGLHRDPAIFPKLTQSQREMRVRLWTTALEFALQSSLDSSLPIGLTPEEYDVPLPSNVNDDDLHLESGNSFRTSGQFTDASLQRLLAKSQALRLRVVRFISAISTDATGQLNDSHAYEAVLDLGAQLRAANREVAAFFQDEDFLSLRDQFDATSLHASEFHRKFIDISLRRYTLVLHRPSMVRARKDPHLYLSRKICTDSSMVILSHLKGVNMSAPSVELEDLARLALTGRGSFKGPFTFDALMALLFEVSVQLDRNSAQYSERDPYDDVTEAERAPLIKVLENARQQLFQMLGRGSASVKRYLFVMGYMKHVYDAESIQPPKTGMLSYITAEVKQCLAMLRTIEKANSNQGGNLPALGDQAAPDNLAFNSGFLVWHFH